MPLLPIRNLGAAGVITDVDPVAGNTLRWNDLTDGQRAAWTQYRMDLLNLTQQSGFPSAISWPNKPE